MKPKHILLIALAIATALRLFRISQIPGEWFGDISNVHEYVSQILSGDFTLYFLQSAGPLYHYLITPLIIIFSNLGFDTYKLSSVAVSLTGLVATYFLAKEFKLSVWLAPLSVLIMGFSFWYLIWSRLGNSQIIIPAITALSALFLVKYINSNSSRHIYLAVLLASLGWYIYPHTFILPFSVIGFYFLHLTLTRNLRSKLAEIVLISLLAGLMIIPFFNIVKNQPDANFGPSGYVGQKVIPVLNMEKGEFLIKTTRNLSKTLLMLHVRGDRVSRFNVTNKPHLDSISGIFFILGLAFFIREKNKTWLSLIIWLLLTLCLPSISPAIPDLEIPNSNRTIGIVPFVYLLVAAGYIYFYKITKRHLKDLIALVLTITILLFSSFINLKLYFLDYQIGLPEKNLAPGKIIASIIDKTFPTSVNIYFSSCCWGEFGQPEPKAVAYVLRNHFSSASVDKLVTSCDNSVQKPAIIIDHPNAAQNNKLKSCFPNSTSLPVTHEDTRIATILYVP